MPETETDTPSEQHLSRRKRRRILFACALCLLLLAVACSYLQSVTASVSVTLPLSEEVREFLGEEEYTNMEEGSVSQRVPSPGEGVSGAVVPENLPAKEGSADVLVPGGDGSGGGPAVGGAGLGEGGRGEPERGERLEARGDQSSSGGGTPRGEIDTGSQEDGDGGGGQEQGGGGQGPGRRGGGGDGSGASGSGGGSGDGGGERSSSGGGGGRSEQYDLIVMLRAANGRILYPRYRFAGGNGELILEERRFVPGLYTLILTKRYRRSGREETVAQEFAWGVLALNTDQDRYRPGETARIDIGVLDDLGAIVCDADLELTITNPNGVVTTITTDDGGIRVTGTCGVKEAGFINPDYEAFVTMNTEGMYRLELLAKNFLGNSHKLTADVQVVSHPPFVIHRSAATRLWPFAPSPMTIDVEFLADFSGTITDTVPDGFGITDSLPRAKVELVPATRELMLTWSGAWKAGETARFWYEYDAPDVSPEFYLVGPLILACRSEPCRTMANTASPFGPAAVRSDRDVQDDAVYYELRQWQIANDNEGESANYRIPSDVQAAGGGELAVSTNYKLSDTIGESLMGLARTALYALQSGYRHTDDSYIALGCGDSVDLGSLAGEGQSTGSIDCTVVADGAGYSLSWKGGAPDYGLVGYWKLDETSGTTAYDLSGYGNNASHQGAPAVSTSVPSTHFSTRSLSFSSATSDYLDAGTSVADSIEAAGSISVWAKRSGTVGGALFNRTSGTSWADERLTLYMRSDTNRLGWSMANGTNYQTVTKDIDTVFPTDTWKHFVLTWDGSNVKFYVDGVQDTDLSAAQSYAPEVTGLATRIGWSQGLLNQYYNGLIDEVRLYDRALSTGEILALASTGPPASMVSENLDTIPPMEFPSTGGLVGHWKFDEIAGTVAADSSGNGNDGAHVNTPTISTSLPSNANIGNVRSLSFDETSSEYVSASANNIPVGSSARTYAAWVNYQGDGGNIVGSNASSGQKYYFEIVQVGGTWYVFTDGVNSANNITVTGDQIPSSGTWHHLAFTKDASDNWVYYLDGVNKKNGTFSTAINTSAATSVWIGDRSDVDSGDIYEFDGLIDDVRIYNRALSAAEIKALAAVPQTWSISTSTAYWGSRLSSTSTDTDSKWGTDSSSEKWLAIGNGDYTVVSRTGRTAVGGSTETFQFRTEVGSDKIQAPGTYKGAVTITATAL